MYLCNNQLVCTILQDCVSTLVVQNKVTMNKSTKYIVER